MEASKRKKEYAMSDIIYTCAVCGKRVTSTKGKPIPLCCKKEMEPLPFCTSQPHPEMARNYDEDLPCDDGTLAKPKPAFKAQKKK
jgi:hypothetical protein